MSESLRSMSVVLTMVMLLAGGGCVADSSNSTANRPAPAVNTNATTATATTPAPATAKTGAAAPNTQPVTLPILDAFFAQENFAAELKAKLQLTDEQVNQLRTIARQETSKLRASDHQDESAGRTTAARADAYEKCKAAIGEEKTQELIAFVNE